MSETSKQRRSRINLRYYKVPDAYAVWRRRLTLVAISTALAWLAIAPMAGSGKDSSVRLFQRDALASKGPLSRSHAMWDAECQACHVPFTAVNGSRWSPALAGVVSKGNEKCQNCHAGPAHHASQLESDTPSCAECHRDHRGRDASLLNMADAVCTTCHADLSRHRDPKAGPLATAESVTRFSANPREHPEFTPASDSAAAATKRVKFNHARHLASGMTTDKQGIPLWTFTSFKTDNDRVRYGWTPGRDRDPVQLNCQSCHRLNGESDGAGHSGNSAPARALGALMVPVTFERDCHACHRLEYDAQAPGREVRHGQKAAMVVEEVERLYAADVVTHDQALLRRFVPPEPLPGKAVEGDVGPAQTVVADKTLTALKRLFGTAFTNDSHNPSTVPQGRGGCVECHNLTATRPLVDLAAARTAEIEPVVVRPQWFQSAAFDHAKHRAMDCAACHAGVAESTDQTRLILPGVSQCVSCHSPASTQNGEPRGGAGTACVECHQYHNGDHSRTSDGSRQWRGRSPMSSEQFSRGGLTSGR